MFYIVFGAALRLNISEVHLLVKNLYLEEHRNENKEITITLSFGNLKYQTQQIKQILGRELKKSEKNLSASQRNKNLVTFKSTIFEGGLNC